MAAAPDEAIFDIGHPAPDRGRVGLGALMLCLFGAPALWSLQHLLLDGFASHYCPTEPHSGWIRWLLPAINLIALLGAGLALALAIRSLRRTRHEHDASSGGVMDAGEGRTRFLSIWGIWIGVLFIVAIAYNTISAFWTGLCR